MLKQPRRRTYRKWHKGSAGAQFVISKLQWGSIGLRATENGRLTARQLEARRRSIRRLLPRTVRLWTRPFPDRPVTRKPVRSRMGKGKGAVSFWRTYVQAGTILFEIDGADQLTGKFALRRASAKLPILTRVTEKPEPLI